MRGGFIGTNVVPAVALYNSAASGVWTLREAEGFKRAGTWPINSITTLNISGLVAFLHASEAVVSGSNVNSWPASIGGFSLNSKNGQPTYDATGFNGRPEVKFDGVDDALRTSANVLSLGLANEMSMFVAMRAASLPGFSKIDRRYVVLGGETTNQLGHYLSVRLYDNVAQTYVAALTKAATADARIDSTVSTTTQRKFHGMTYDGTTLRQYLNNTLVNTNNNSAVSGATTSSGTLTVGNQFVNSAYDDFWTHVNIAALVIFSRVITSQERTDLYSYFNSIYSFQ
jgi:hypothetical protein